MGEVQPMEIDGEEQMKPKIDVVDRKTKQLKRKRVEPSSFATDPEDIQRKINDYRSEINSLVKFCKNLVSENRGTLLENVEKVGKSLNGVIACLIEESDLPLSKLVDDIIEKVKGRTDDSFDTVSKASVKSTVLLIGQRLCYGVPNADADLLEDEDECALWYWEVFMLRKASGTEGPRGHAVSIMTEVLVDAKCKDAINATQKKYLLQENALQLS